MDEITSKLNQILNDPGSMQQILDMAAAFGLPTQELPKTIEQVDPEQMSKVLHTAEARGKKQQALIHALLPYLRPGRQARLERAMQVAHLTHLASAALGSSVLQGFRKEAPTDV